jgi:hypothetical protein
MIIGKIMIAGYVVVLTIMATGAAFVRTIEGACAGIETQTLGRAV